MDSGINFPTFDSVDSIFKKHRARHRDRVQRMRDRHRQFLSPLSLSGNIDKM